MVSRVRRSSGGADCFVRRLGWSAPVLVGLLLAGCAAGGGGSAGGGDAASNPVLARPVQSTPVGVVDTGFYIEHPEVSPSIQAYQVFSDGQTATTDATTIRDTEDPHGTFIAQVIAGPTRGTVMTRGDAKLLLGKATPYNLNAPSEPADYVFDTRDIEVATLWAIDRGARVMNYSLGPMYVLDSYLRSAFEYAEARDVAMVVAAGNEGVSVTREVQAAGSSASLFSSSRLRNKTLVVGVVERNGSTLERASYSNYPGTSTSVQNRFLVAPGPVEVLDQFPVEGRYGSFEAYGTSLATPQVSAALASLLARWPHLDAVSSTQILLDTANSSFSDLYGFNDCGDGGRGSGSSNCGRYYFGQGLLDLEAALMPVGPTRFVTGQTVDGASVPASTTRMRLSPAFGDASARLAIRAAVFDAYGRDFAVNLGTRIEASENHAPTRHWWAALHQRRSTHEGPDHRLELAYAASGRVIAAGGRWWGADGQTLHWQRRSGMAHVEDAAQAPWLSLAGQGTLAGFDWVDQIAWSRPILPGVRIQAGWTRGHFERDGAASQRGPMASAAQATEHQLKVDGGALQTLRWTLGWGLTRERGLALGSWGDGGLALNGSSGRSGLVQLDRALGGDWSMFGQVQWARAAVEGLGLLESLDRVRTSRWAAGVVKSSKEGAMGIVVSQPTRVEHAQAKFSVPTGRTIDGQVLHQTHSVGLAPMGRQVNLELALDRVIAQPVTPGSSGRLGMHLIYAHEAGHVRGARSWGVLGGYRIAW